MPRRCAFRALRSPIYSIDWDVVAGPILRRLTVKPLVGLCSASIRRRLQQRPRSGSGRIVFSLCEKGWLAPLTAAAHAGTIVVRGTPSGKAEIRSPGRARARRAALPRNFLRPTSATPTRGSGFLPAPREEFPGLCGGRSDITLGLIPFPGPIAGLAWPIRKRCSNWRF